MAYEGHDEMYTGKPSKPGRTQVQIGYGLVKGDGKGFIDNADSTFSGNGEWDSGDVNNGLPTGKRKRVPSRKEQS
jgi:hypothetical protein